VGKTTKQKGERKEIKHQSVVWVLNEKKHEKNHQEYSSFATS